MAEQFVWSDAWILLAIIYAGEEGNIPTISSIADGIEHAVPTEDELNGAFARLTKGGYIEKDGDKYRASASTIEAFLKSHTPRRYVAKEFNDMKRLLGVL